VGTNSGIAWTNHTFNPWWGCTKVSPGCDHCYAETFDRRLGGEHWGKDAPRRIFGDKHWNEPLRWNAAAQKTGVPALVFCASMADWCDVDAPPGAVERLHGLWRATPWLRWQMLTKRPARIAANLPPDWGQGYPNVWLGATVDDRKNGIPRVTVLRTLPAVVRFLSIEPLLEDLGDFLLDGIGWVIVGGESGHGARPFHLSWARDLKRQCERAGVAFFMKQMGACASDPENGIAGAALKIPDEALPLLSKRLRDQKGGDMSEWPEELRVQEFPR